MEEEKLKRRLREVSKRLKELQRKTIWDEYDLELAAILEEEIAILKEKLNQILD